MVTYEQAIDEMFNDFYVSWLANSASIVSYVPNVRWPNIDEGSLDAGKFLARLSQQTVIEKQASLRGEENLQRYTTYGLIFVQIFCPRSDSTAMEKGRKLANLARNVFRGHSTQNNVWFKNARVQELEPEQKFYRLNVIAEYEYDEVA
ncbi:MAG: hypothetical protein ACREVA_07960 [Burkholderiales bacterium]